MFRERSGLALELASQNAILTLNRPEKRNALSTEMLTSLCSAMREVSADTRVRTITLAANGTVFSAGHDLTELAGREQSNYRELFAQCTELMLLMQSIPQPVIAEVQGLATAAGCQLVAASDLAIASTNARFATPGVKIGLFCTTPMVPLVRAVGRKRAMEMLLTGGFITAETALLWGLVNRVVPPHELRQTTMAFASLIGESSADVVRTGKRAFYDQVDLAERTAYERAIETMSSNAAEPDAQEGVSAFLGKRRPVWRS